MKTVVLEITGIECPNCSMRLEQMEDRCEGIQMVEASYRKAQMVVRYDEEIISLQQIAEEVQKLGYSVKSE